jgi:hypothetical protein
MNVDEVIAMTRLHRPITQTVEHHRLPRLSEPGGKIWTTSSTFCVTCGPDVDLDENDDCPTMAITRKAAR